MDNIVDKYSVVADTIHGQILISQFEKEVIATTLFNRLHGIHQNSTAYMTFPANRTKRVEHSFGTMYLCGNIFSNSICNASTSVVRKFLDKAECEVKKILETIRTASEYQSKLGQLVKKVRKSYEEMKIEGGIYDRILCSNVSQESQKIYIIVFESVRIAALLHDVGHPPFSHITEFALKNVCNKVSLDGIKTERTKEFKKIVAPFFDKDGNELHEEMGNAISRALLKEAIKDIDESEAKDSLKYNKQLFRLIVAEMVINIFTSDSAFFEDLHSIISGTLDGDRLDYVSRDPINSGFTTGIIEYERLVSSMKLAQKDDHFLFCPSTSVVNTIEDFLMRRWNMYRNIIYHHRVVKTDYLLQKCIEEMAIDYLKAEEGEEESESYILPYDISGLWKALRNQSSVLEQGYSISQWDDAWLMTILKKEYFEKVIDETTMLNKMLTELLTNKKRFASLIKRKEEFGVIDKEVAKGIVSGKEEIRKIINKLRENQEALDKSEQKKYFDIDAFIKNVDDLFEKAKKYNLNSTLTEIDGFLLVYIRKLLKINKKEKLQEIIEKAISEYGNNQYMVVFKYPKTGTSKDLYICKKYYEEEDKQFETLKGISDISLILNNNLNFSPFFFIYVDMEKVKKEDFDFKKERERVGQRIAEEICKAIQDIFQQYLGE